MKLRPLFYVCVLLQALVSAACVHSGVLQVNAPRGGYFAQYPAPGGDMIAYTVPVNADGTSQTLLVMCTWLRGDVVRVQTASTSAWLRPTWLRMGPQRYLVVEDHPDSHESRLSVYAIDKYGSKITARGLYRTPRQAETEYVFAHWNPRERTLLLKKSEAYADGVGFYAKSTLTLELEPEGVKILREVSLENMECDAWFRLWR